MADRSTETSSGPRRLPADDTTIAEAAAELERGEVVAFPTETVYGLGGSTLCAAALEKIYRLKGRPADNPLIAHVANQSEARAVTTGWDDRCTLLTNAWWPGPLTLVLGRAAAVPDLASGGRPTLAVRSPEHPVAQALLEAFGGPISAPSANRSGGVSPTRASHVVEDFRDHPAADGLIVLDGDHSRVGIESTVIDMTVDPPRILRPGVLTPEVLEPLIGPVEITSIQDASASPGTSEHHYAPQTPCQFVDPARIDDTLAALDCRCVVLTTQPLVPTNSNVVIQLPADPAGYAAELYDAMRRADRERADLILLACGGEDDPNWLAIRDRLMRAAADRAS